MTTVVDAVVHYIGGMCKAALNAHATGWCKSVWEIEPYESPPSSMFPVLVVYRESETTEQSGTAGKRLRRAKVMVEYSPGKTAATKLVEAAAIVAEAAGVVDDVLADQSFASYESGASLETLAAVEELTVERIEYVGGTGPDEYPGFRATLEVLHGYLRGDTTPDELTEIIGNLNSNTDLDATVVEYDTGKDLSLTPLGPACIFTLTPGASLAVAVTDYSVTCTFIAGTTTLTALAAKVAADADAAALVTVSGDAGTLPVSFAGGSWDLLAPLARQSSDTEE